MVNKVLGYVLFAVGIVLGALSYKGIRTLAGLNIPDGYDTYLLIASLILIALGAWWGFKKTSGNKQGEEVPIYEGEGKKRKIVGYKRLG